MASRSTTREWPVLVGPSTSCSRAPLVLTTPTMRRICTSGRRRGRHAWRWHHPGVLLTARPTADRRVLRDVIRNLHIEVQNVRSANDRISAYFGWTDNAARQLRTLITPGDMQRLVLTPRYWALF